MPEKPYSARKNTKKKIFHFAFDGFFLSHPSGGILHRMTSLCTGRTRSGPAKYKRHAFAAADKSGAVSLNGGSIVSISRQTV